MTIGADLGVLAAAGDGLVERWRDLGPTLWLIAGVLAAAWLAVLALLAAVRDPRRVRPGPAALELQGPESPAVVNLLTTDWDLGHEAVPATLVALAAKRRIEIEMVGDDTFVRVRRLAAGDGASLTGYEGMVLDHVVGRQAEPVGVGQFLDPGPGPVADAVQLLGAQYDVLHHGEVVGQHEVLEHHADTLLDRVGR